MSWTVYISDDAKADLSDIARHIVESDGPDRALSLFAELERVCASLGNIPSRGHAPPELARLGIKQFKQLHFKPYRIVYEVGDKRVDVLCVLDGRRDMQDLLERRLLR